MRIIISIITLSFCIFNGCEQKTDYGKVVITQFDYGTSNDSLHFKLDEYGYFPFDNIPFSMVQQPTANLNYFDEYLLFENIFSTGYSGNEIKITINKNLQITDASFYKWTDTNFGDSTNYFVEKVILELDKDPFTDSSFKGRYSLQIRQDYFSNGFHLAKDTTFRFIYKGKFKF